jgi:hypothetical protein
VVVIDPLAGVVAALPQVLLDVYRMRRDGSVPEQLERAARIHAQELAREHQSRLEQAVWETRLRVLEQVELVRVAAEHAESPFGHIADEDVREQVERLTDGRKRPALLIAPLLNTTRTNQGNIDQPYSYRVSLRSGWLESPWSSDMQVDAGLIGQPLLRTDLHLRRIRELLADLPITVVHGFIEEGDKVRLEIVAWNIINGASDQLNNEAIQIHISDFSSVGVRRLPTVSEALALACSQLCAVLAEWFYVARGREPHRHRDLPGNLAKATAAGSLVALSLGLDRQHLDRLTALVHQAILHADLGEVGPLVDALNSVNETLREIDEDEDTAERLLRLLHQTVIRAASSGKYAPERINTIVNQIAAEHSRACHELIRRKLLG